MFLPSKLRYALYGLAFGLAVSVYPFGAFSAVGCEPTKSVITGYLSSGYALLLSGTTSQGFHIIMLADASGNWLIIGIDEDETACVLAHGDDMMFFANEGI